MLVDTKYIVSMTEANQNFSKVAKLAHENGKVLVLKNNKPNFLIIDLNVCPNYYEMAKKERVHEISDEILEENKEAYEELAKW